MMFLNFRVFTFVSQTCRLFEVVSKTYLTSFLKLTTITAFLSNFDCNHSECISNFEGCTETAGFVSILT